MKKNKLEIGPLQEKIISVVNKVVLDKGDEFSRDDMKYVLSFLEDSKISALDIYPLLMKSDLGPFLASPLMDIQLKDGLNVYSPKILWQNLETGEYKDLSGFKDKLILIKAIKEKLNEQNGIVDDTVLKIENFSGKKPFKKIILGIVVFSAIIGSVLKFSGYSESEGKNFAPVDVNNSKKILEKKVAEKNIAESPQEVVKQIVEKTVDDNDTKPEIILKTNIAPEKILEKNITKLEQNIKKAVDDNDTKPEKILEKNTTSPEIVLQEKEFSEQNNSIEKNSTNISDQFIEIVENGNLEKNIEKRHDFPDNNLEFYGGNLQKLKQKFIQTYSKNNEKILDTSLDLKTEEFRNKFNEIYDYVMENIDKFSDKRIEEISLKNNMSVYRDKLEILNTLFPGKNIQESYEKHYIFIVGLVNFKGKNVALKIPSAGLLKYVKGLKKESFKEDNLENK